MAPMKYSANITGFLSKLLLLFITCSSSRLRPESWFSTYVMRAAVTIIWKERYAKYGDLERALGLKSAWTGSSIADGGEF